MMNWPTLHLCIKKAKESGKWNGKDYTKGFVLSEDKNTQDFKVEVYDYDPTKIELFADRAESIMFYYDRVFEERKMVARPKDATSPTCKRCKECFMREACWNIGRGKVRIDINND